MTKKDINTAFFSMMDTVLKPMGFKKTKQGDGYSYVKKTEYGLNQVAILVWVYGDMFYTSLAFMTRLSELNDVYNPFSIASPRVHGENATFTTAFSCEGCDEMKRLKVHTREDLQKAVDTWSEVIKKDGFSFFEQFTTVDAFDKEINRDSREADLYMNEFTYRPIIGLTAAALNKNKDFSKWEDYYRKVEQHNPDDIRNKFEELVRLLKEKYISS